MRKAIVFVSIPQVLAVHDRAIKRFGGSHGVRDMGLLESAVARPQATFGGTDLYLTLFNKAAALLQSLLKNHPFIDGNKRTALSTTGIFLKLNGYSLKNTHKDEVQFALDVANNKFSLEEISQWLKKNSIKV